MSAVVSPSTIKCCRPSLSTAVPPPFSACVLLLLFSAVSVEAGSVVSVSVVPHHRRPPPSKLLATQGSGKGQRKRLKSHNNINIIHNANINDTQAFPFAYVRPLYTIIIYYSAYIGFLNGRSLPPKRSWPDSFLPPSPPPSRRGIQPGSSRSHSNSTTTGVPSTKQDCL